MGKMLSPNSIKTCWIAEIKRSLGFPMRRAWNSGSMRASVRWSCCEGFYSRTCSGRYSR